MVAGPVNKHERDRLTARTILILEGLLTTAGNRTSRQGIPIEVPSQTAEHIHALARDVLVHGARKARLEPKLIEPDPQWRVTA